MTAEEKQLLLKDLCARLPYGVRVKSSRRRNTVTLSLDVMTDFHLGCSIKPYLRPMSSMTEEEVKELIKTYLKRYSENSNYRKNLISIDRISFDKMDNSWSAWIEIERETEIITTCVIVGRINWETTLAEIDWLNAHHFDYRGLIEKGLAIETEEGIYKNMEE